MTGRLVVELEEAGEPTEMPLPDWAAASLAQHGVAQVSPTHVPGRWWVRTSNLVGVGVVGDLEVRIAPKVGIRRLLHLLGYMRNPRGWQSSLVDVAEADGLVEAAVRSLLVHVDPLVRRGLLMGYRSADEVLPVLRGRLREADQLRRRPGLSFPLEVRFDEWTIDVLENRLLKAAAGALLRLPMRDRELRQRLRGLYRGALSDVADVPPRQLIGRWRSTRLNERYGPALAVAELVLQHRSFERGHGAVPIPGFLVNMPAVFEDFVCIALREALRGAGGNVALQLAGHLDTGDRVDLRPDLVWRTGDRYRAVVDAKYKAERPSGHPNADVYQMLAYCTALGLREGHLVYARGNEAPATYRIRNVDVSIRAWALDLEQDVDRLLDSIAEIARRLQVPPVASAA